MFVIGNSTQASEDKKAVSKVVSMPGQTAQTQSPTSPNDLISAESLVIDMIQSSIAQDSWPDMGGSSTVNILGGCLVVSASERTLHDLDQLQFNLTKTMSQ